MNQIKAGWGKFAWILMGMLFLCISFAVWNSRARYSFTSSSESELSPGKPILKVGFGEDEELEVLGLGMGSWTYGTLTIPTPKGLALLISAKGTGSSGYSFGQDKSNLQTDTRESGNKRIGIRVFCQDADLLMAIRILGNSGNILDPESGELEDLVLELSDNAGNWNSGYGPHVVFEKNKGILVAGFGGWPRTGATLRFRIGRTGAEATEFELPNPNYGKIPATWVPEKLPSTISCSDWELTLSKISEISIPGDGRFLIPQDDFTDKVSTGGNWSRGIDLIRENAVGALGTDSHEESVMLENGDLVGRGYRMPPDEELFKIRYSIRYLANYPYKRPEFKIFASGKVSADGKKIEVTSFDKKIGITELNIGDVATNSSRFRDGSHTLRFEVVRQFSNATEKVLVNRFFGDWQKTTAAVFLGSESISSGSFEANSWGSSDLGTKGSYKWGATWTGDLSPGMELQFGLMPEKQNVEMDFAVERSSLVPK